jgi:hypothetical protein
MQKLLPEKNRSLMVVLNWTFWYIDDFLSINDDHFHCYVDSICPSELEIKDTIYSSTSASYLDILLQIDKGGKLRAQLNDKRDYFSFSIISFPCLNVCRDIPSSSTYSVRVSQLIRYDISSYDQFPNQGRLRTRKSILNRFLQSRLKSAFHKFYGHYITIKPCQTGQQGMLTPPGHLVPPVVCPGSVFAQFSGFLFHFMKLITVRYITLPPNQILQYIVLGTF